MNKGQPLNRGKGRKGGWLNGGKQGERLRLRKIGRVKSGGEGEWFMVTRYNTKGALDMTKSICCI